MCDFFSPSDERVGVFLFIFFMGTFVLKYQKWYLPNRMSILHDTCFSIPDILCSLREKNRTCILINIQAVTPSCKYTNINTCNSSTVHSDSLNTSLWQTVYSLSSLHVLSDQCYFVYSLFPPEDHGWILSAEDWVYWSRKHGLWNSTRHS